MPRLWEVKVILMAIRHAGTETLGNTLLLRQLIMIRPLKSTVKVVRRAPRGESEDENTAAKEPAVNNSMDHTVDHQSDSFVIEIPENMDTDNQPSLPKSPNNASQGASDDHE